MLAENCEALTDGIIRNQIFKTYPMQYDIEGLIVKDDMKIDMELLKEILLTRQAQPYLLLEIS